jgi:hypothetical protein
MPLYACLVLDEDGAASRRRIDLRVVAHTGAA